MAKEKKESMHKKEEHESMGMRKKMEHEKKEGKREKMSKR